MLKMIEWINEESSGNKSCKMMHNIIRSHDIGKSFRILSLRIFLLSFSLNLPKVFAEMIMNISVRSCFLSNSEEKAEVFWLYRCSKTFTDYLVFLKGKANGKVQFKRIKKIRGDYKLFFLPVLVEGKNLESLSLSLCSPTS